MPVTEFGDEIATTSLWYLRLVSAATAETLGAASHHGASVLVAAPNAGGPIERAANAEGISYAVRTS
jgi:hypothetical protein